MTGVYWSHMLICLALSPQKLFLEQKIMSVTKKLLIFLVLFFPVLAFAQNGTIKGTVRDDSNAPVGSAKVHVKGTTIQTVTDVNGNYELTNVPYGTVVVVVGEDSNPFATETVNVNSSTVAADISSHAAGNEASLSSGDIPTISLGEDDSKESSSQAVSSVLTASRDPFSSAATFVFSAARFRIRGYEDDNFPTLMNGALMTDLANGRSEYSVWTGLNDVVRSRDNSYGLAPTGFAFGGVGGVYDIDSRASRQRKQLSVSYASSNRTYDNRLMVTYGSGVNSKGWAYSLSYSRRWADEGYVKGTFYDGHSFFGSVEKVVNADHSVSLTAFAANTKNGRSAPSVQEMFDLAGTNYYNPSWGYQDGKVRNAVVGKNFQPMIILSHNWNVNDKSTLESAVSYQFGKNKVSGIDWYNAEDPRPDYYRNLPSFDPSYGENPDYKADSTTLANYLAANESARQINWSKLYEANQLHDTAQYVIANRVTDAKRFGFNTTYNNNYSDHTTFTAGFCYQKQDINYYKEVEDLLGGNYFVDLNQFADQTTLSDSANIQNNADNPNRKIYEGDKYAYDYTAHIQRSEFWMQAVWKYTKFDLFLSQQFVETNYYREGNVRNGIFYANSLGESMDFKFIAPSTKGGVTYKMNGRNYFYVNGALMQRAPLFENVFVSPRTRNLAISGAENEKISSVEGGYLYRAPKMKFRLTGYITQFSDISDARSFYYDDYKTFVNYAVTNIDKKHTGLEIAYEVNLGKGLTASAVASVGQFIYNDRPKATVTQDNKDTLLAIDETIFAKNLRVSGGPQSAYTVGFNYRSKHFWFANINFNYFENFYVDFNPVRRTMGSLENVNEGTPGWESILGQEHFKGQFTMDISGGWSWKMNNKFKSLKGNSFMVLNLGITNVLDNRHMLSTGYEQLRFDTREHDVNVFPTKFAYAYGATYFASVTFRFN